MVETTTHTDLRGERVDGPADTRLTPAPGLLDRISWGAIFAGAVIALGLTALLGLMGTALGFGAIEPGESDPFGGLGVGTAIWWILTSVIALGVGGYAAGRAAGQPGRSSAMTHGAAMWGLATIATLWMATTAVGAVVNTAASTVATVAQTGAQVVGTVGGAVLPDDVDLDPQIYRARQAVRTEAQQILAEAGVGESDLEAAREAAASSAQDAARRPGQIDEEIDQLIDNLFDGEDAVFSPTERQQLVAALSERAGVTPQEAEQIAGRWEQQAQSAASAVDSAASQVGSAAVSASDSALDALSSVAWYAFFASLLSLIAALIGSAVGAPSRPYLQER